MSRGWGGCLEPAEVLRSQQGGRHDGDPVLVPVGQTTGGHQDCVREPRPDLLAQPAQVLGVFLLGGGPRLDLVGDDPTIGSFEDDVDLLEPAFGAQVEDPGTEDLGVDLKTLNHQGLE